MKKFLAVGTAALAMAYAAAPAYAVTVLPTETLLLTSNGAGLGADYKYTNTLGVGAFSKTYQFTIPSGGLAAGTISTNWQAKSQHIDITSVLLNGNPLNLIKTGGVSQGTATGSLFDIVGLLGPNANKLVVNFSTLGAGGFYNGSVSFLPGVPEPSTWAMMILGLGFAGAVMRRRQQVSVRYA